MVAALRENQVDVLVSYLPVGSEQADKFYAQCAIDAGVGFVNALPVFIASDPVWAQKFADAGVPIVGDDIKSQVGATITHRVLAKLFEDRGVKLERTYQLNFGGNMDFKNMLERSRLKSKKISKTQAVTSQIPHEMRDADVHIGPSDFVPFLEDQKHALVRLEGPRLRRCADPAGVQARGVGLAQLGRHHHRRSPRLQDRHGSWHGGPGSQRKLVFHEEPTRPVRRLNRARRGRAVHSRLILDSTRSEWSREILLRCSFSRHCLVELSQNRVAPDSTTRINLARKKGSRELQCLALLTPQVWAGIDESGFGHRCSRLHRKPSVRGAAVEGMDRTRCRQLQRLLRSRGARVGTSPPRLITPASS